ncbi:FecCD family ABC transporter permease [Microbacterium halotolerans]|uniref:FecCD family ABC transporter permease n=1 Tax=Microbacterium halotolerans TaxID=246613 RepID=UPI000E6AD783|nr:iron chelate uptake ABC transporter family permease subunit [Microbacterium halotolerans]
MSTQLSGSRHAPGRVDFGHAVVRVRAGRLRGRFAVRSAVTAAVLAGISVVLALVALTLGDYPVPLTDVVLALTGQEAGTANLIVVEWRAPRALAALVFGAALGVSGAIFQSLTRNPLASPDIIGFSTGSFTGALVVIIVIGGSYLQVAAGALVGGILTAALVYMLAYRRGVQGFRFIIVGIGISAMLASLNTWMMLRADLEVAMSAAVWNAGSLNGITWAQAGAGSVAIAALMLVAAAQSSGLRQIELGDDAAKALGVRIEPLRLGLIVTGVALTAAVTAAAGPISFIALAAPQIARRLARTPGVTLIPAATMGALLLLVADILAQHALPASLPVGVVTVVIGGSYLVWLLIHEARRRT